MLQLLCNEWIDNFLLFFLFNRGSTSGGVYPELCRGERAVPTGTDQRIQEDRFTSTSIL